MHTFETITEHIGKRWHASPTTITVSLLLVIAGPARATAQDLSASAALSFTLQEGMMSCTATPTTDGPSVRCADLTDELRCHRNALGDFAPVEGTELAWICTSCAVGDDSCHMETFAIVLTSALGNVLWAVGGCTEGAMGETIRCVFHAT